MYYHLYTRGIQVGPCLPWKWTNFLKRLNLKIKTLKITTKCPMESEYIAVLDHQERVHIFTFGNSNRGHYSIALKDITSELAMSPTAQWECPSIEVVLFFFWCRRHGARSPSFLRRWVKFQVASFGNPCMPAVGGGIVVDSPQKRDSFWTWFFITCFTFRPNVHSQQITSRHAQITLKLTSTTS